jgi:hypothetical protein
MTLSLNDAQTFRRALAMQAFSLGWRLRFALEQAELVQDGVRDVRLHDATCAALSRAHDAAGVDRDWHRMSEAAQAGGARYLDLVARGGSLAWEAADAEDGHGARREYSGFGE